MAKSVQQDPLLTAAFENAPAGHDGSTGFRLELRFSEEVDLSYRAFTNGLLTVSGGTNGRASRLSPPSNVGWWFPVTPDGNDDVVVTLPANRPCNTLTGPCTPDGRQLSAAASVTIPGPSTEEPPQITGSTSLQVAEGTTAVAALTATDADTPAVDLVWTLDGGADRSAFSLTEGGMLTFAQAKDFEGPDDADTDGSYQVTVQVSDGGSTATADLTVTLTDVNEAPAANAGDDQTGIPGAAPVTLAGSGTDPDARDTLTYAWTRTAGPAVALGGADTATATFTAPAGLTVDTTFTFQLTVTDAAGLTHTDTVSVTVARGAALTAAFERVPDSHDGSASFDVRLRFSEEVRLSFRAFTANLLEVTGGTVDKAKRLSPPSNIGWLLSATPSGDADVALTLPAGGACDGMSGACTSDGRRLSQPASATIAGPAQAEAAAPVITSPDSFTVAENATAVATLTATDEDTAAADLTWSMPAGADGGADGGKFSLTAGGALSFAAAKDFEDPDDADSDGSYRVTVQVSDGDNTATADLTVTLSNENEAPTADAGADQPDIEAGAAVTLNGTGTDPDANDELTFAWTQTAGTTVTLSDVAAAAPTFTAPADFTGDAFLTFALRVTDTAGLHHEDSVKVTARTIATGPAPQTPTVDWTRLTLTFSSELDADSVPPASAFTVLVGDSARAVAHVSVSAASVVLALTLPVAPTDAVTVAYEAPAEGGLADDEGNAVATFEATAATNATPKRLAMQGPGLGNLRYSAAENFEPVSWIREVGPHPGGTTYYGTNVGIMLNGFFVTVFGRNTGAGTGGFLIYDVSDPRNISLVRQVYDPNGTTRQFREAHSLPAARIGSSIYLAVQSTHGIELWDFTDMDNIHRESKLVLPGVAGGDYANVAWQTSWQAPYLYVATSSQGFYVVDTSDPSAPFVADRGHRRRNPVPPAEYGGFRVGPLFAMGNHLVATSMQTEEGWASLDIGNPLNPVLLDTVPASETGKYYSTCFDGRRIHSAPRRIPAGVEMLSQDLSDPSSFALVKRTRLTSFRLYCATQDNYLFLGGQGDFRKHDTSTSPYWVRVGTGSMDIQNPDHGQVAPMGNLVFVGNDKGTGSAFFVHDRDPDLRPPAVVEVSPRDGAVNQPLTTRIGVGLTDSVLLASVGPQSVRLVDAAGQAVDGTFSVQLGIVNFTPDRPLQPDTAYTVQVLAGGVSDYAGNRVQTAFTSRFTTTSELPVEPVHRWALEDDAQDWFDRNDGTVVGGTFATDGGLRLDGTGDWVKLASSLSEVLAGDASVAFFLSTTQTGHAAAGQAPGVTGRQDADGTDDAYWGWLDGTGRLRLSVGDGAGIMSPQPVNDGKLHHYVLTRRASSGLLAMYRDGVQVAQGIGGTGTRDGGGSYDRLGAIEGSRASLSGTLRDVQVFNHDLTAVQVALLYGSADAGVTQATVDAVATVNEATIFEAESLGDGATYQWDFGDGSSSEADPSRTASHTYTQAGHYTVVLTVTSGTQTLRYTFARTVTYPRTSAAPTASSTIAGSGHLVYTVNPDDTTVTAIHRTALTKSWTAHVGKHPRTVATDRSGRAWVAVQGSDTLVCLDQAGEHCGTIDTGYGSAPYGIAFIPGKDTALVTLQGSGEVLRFNASTATVLGRQAVNAEPRGIAITGDGAHAYVTRLRSTTAGLVTKIDASTLAKISDISLRVDDTGVDSEDRARGKPNYLTQIVISPDGRTAWVPSKQDNTLRGTHRDGSDLTHETTVRAIASVIDLSGASELFARRMDFDDRSGAVAVAFSPLGDYAFVVQQGSNSVAVVDAYSRAVKGELGGGAGLAPDGIWIDGTGKRAFVSNLTTRSVAVFDIEHVLAGITFEPPPEEEIATVFVGRLTAEQSRGQQIFYNARDPRMSRDGYISCASCHLGGADDGTVWDFTGRDEGLRNTISLNGRRGTALGRVHWTANFDEIQDFEDDIRNSFGGSGFMTQADFDAASEPLGTTKAGRSRDLDALAAYVSSLDDFGRSPYRTGQGGLTAAAAAGETLFKDLNCRSCHAGAAFTDGQRHDVGTVVSGSGTASGQALAGSGFKTPSLLGVWRTAPYFHNGSAATLAAVVDARHGGERAVTADERAQLVAYLRSLDRATVAERVLLTASITNLPESHDGRTSFTFTLKFSEEVDLTFTDFRDGLFELTGATVAGTRRFDPGSNQGWTITLRPNGNGPVIVVLPAGRACSETAAVCTLDGTRVARRLAVAVPGPTAATAPVATVAAVADSVAEGSEAAFQVRLDAMPASPVSVAVAVTQTGSVLLGATPTSVRFEVGETRATLSLATDDDQLDEADGTVSVTLSAGGGYTAGSPAVASVTVEDNDEAVTGAAPEITSQTSLTVAEGVTAVATLTATDADTDTSELTWSIPAGTSGGADGARFTLTSAGELAFSAPKDFEVPDDVGADGSYQVTVQVSDGGRTDTADLTVTLTNVNEAPTADAGLDQAAVAPGATVTLAGSGSDPDENDTLTFAWTQTGAPAVTLSDAAAASPTFTALADIGEDTTLSFTLRVTDGDGLYHEHTVTVTVLPEDRVPNIVLILADDLGVGDVAYLNDASRIPTPSLDDLAREGVAFRDAHSPSSVCTPTRLALLTGRYAWRTWRSGVLNGYARPAMAKGQPTLGSFLDEAGYRTAIVGKWHLGLEYQNLPDWTDFTGPLRDGPHTRGFDESFIIPSSLDFAPYLYIRNGEALGTPLTEQPAKPFPHFMRSGPTAVDFDPQQVLDDLVHESTDFIERHADSDQPFFLYLPLTAPHSPVWPSEDFAGSTGLGPYGDFIAQLDAATGVVLQSLEDEGVADNTLVVFTSDNGSFMHRYADDATDHTEDETVGGYRPSNHTANGVHRGTKADIWEGGHRVPFFVRWPGKVTPGSRRDETISLTDLFATFAEIVDRGLPARAGEDSYSLVPLLRGDTWDTPRPPVIHHSSRGMFAIRDGRWKLVAGNGSGGREQPRGEPDGRPFQLFDLEADPAESNNVLDANPAVAERLEGKLQEIRWPTSLASLVLSDVDIGTFDRERLDYTASAAEGVSSTTVTATPTDGNATVMITDRLGTTSGTARTVSLAEPAGSVFVTVTAAKGGATRTYVVSFDGEGSLAAVFENPPASHDGTGFSLRLRFSEEVALGFADFGRGLLTITGASLGKASRAAPPSNILWDLPVTPAGGGDVVITLPANRPCDADPTVCTADGRRLSTAASVTVSGPAPQPQSPDITGGVAFTVNEGETSVTTLTATDADTQASDLTWSIPSGTSGGPDRDRFRLTSAGALAFAAAKNFEAPDDVGADGSYQVTVQVSDGARTDTADLTVTLTNVNEAPTADAGADQPNVAAGALVTLRGSGTDPDARDALTYAWTQPGGTQVSLSDPAAAAPTFTAPDDLVADAELTFRLRVTDRAGLHDDDSVTVTVAAGAAPLAQVTGVTVTAQEESLSVSWTAVAGADGYLVQWREDGGTYASARQHAVSGGLLSQAIGELTADTLHWVRVAATKAGADDGPWSAEASGTPQSPAAGPEPGDLRLVGGEEDHEGRLEVYHNGEWGTVCDDFWGIQDARVACRQLGYSNADQATRRARFGQGSGPIWMDNTQCTGREARLADCRFRGWGVHNCRHREDAGVVCTTGTDEGTGIGGLRGLSLVGPASGSAAPAGDGSRALNEVVDAALEGAPSAVRVLDLTDGKFGSLAGIERLTGLRVLRLRGNEVSDLSPLAGLQGLRELDLSDNDVADLRPLAGLVELRRLDLSDNAVADVVPLMGLERLSALALDDNEVADLSPLVQAPGLARLRLSRNRITDISPLYGLTGLRELALSGNAVREVWPLAQLSNLERLYLNGNAIEDLQPLSGLTQLQVLDLARNRIESLQGVSRLQRVQTLKLDRNRLSTLYGLSGLASLEALSLRGNGVEDVHTLAPLTNLRWLDLRDNPVSDLAPLEEGALVIWLDGAGDGPSRRMILAPVEPATERLGRSAD